MMTKTNKLIIVTVVLILILLGYYYWSKNKQATLVNSQPVEKNDSFDTWKTYTNDKYGFDFQYPPEINVNEQGPYYSQSGTQPDNLETINVGDTLNIQIFPTSIVQGDYNWPERPCGEWSFGPDDGPISTEHIMFGGDKTTKVLSRGFPDDATNVYYCVNHSKSPLVITFNKAKETQANRILSTFKFTDSDQGIRQINFENYLINTLNLKDCAVESQPLVTIDKIEYFDLDLDGNEEAIVTAHTCFSGTGGADVVDVYKLDKMNRLSKLLLDDAKQFENMDIYKGFAGHFYLSVENGTLVGTYPIYNQNDGNCCPTGGQRKLYYKWNGTKFEIVKVEDSKS